MRRSSKKLDFVRETLNVSFSFLLTAITKVQIFGTCHFLLKTLTGFADEVTCGLRDPWALWAE